MRVGALAELAGVTVRTIRHYHQAGVLPEPPRWSNGYREYGVDDLVTLLRIRQLTGSGMSLTQAGAVLARSLDEGAGASSDEVLDEVDRGLAEQIRELTEQRERLTRARAGHHLGLPPAAVALSVTPTDLPVAMLLVHLYAEHPQLVRLAEAMADPEQRAALAALQERFDAVDDATPEEELEALADEMSARLAVLVAELPALPELSRERTELVLDLVERDLNERQRDLLRRQA